MTKEIQDNCKITFGFAVYKELWTDINEFEIVDFIKVMTIVFKDDANIIFMILTYD